MVRHIYKVLTCLSLFYHPFQGDKHKILENCTLPLTGTNCVDMIITEKVDCLTSQFAIVSRAGVFYSANDDTIFDLRNAFPPSLKLAESWCESKNNFKGPAEGGEGGKEAPSALPASPPLVFYLLSRWPSRSIYYTSGLFVKKRNALKLGSQMTDGCGAMLAPLNAKYILLIHALQH